MKIKKKAPRTMPCGQMRGACVFMLILKSTNQSRSQQASGLVLVVTLLAAGTTVATGTALALNVTLGLLKKHAV